MANLKHFNSATGNWEEIKVSTKFKDLLNTVKLTQDQNYVNIGITNYNPIEDVIFVYQNSTWLQKDQDYVINGGLLRIESKDGSNWSNGDTFNFVILKNVDKDAIPSADGSLIQDGSITIAKLASSLQTYINKIGTAELATVADDLSGAVNEISAQLSDMANNKVDKFEGKGLSTNDYDNIEKAEVAKVANKADITYVDTKVGSLGASATFKGKDTNANILALTGMSVGDEWYDTTNITYLRYNGISWIDVGTDTKYGNNSVSSIMLQDSIVTPIKTDFISYNDIMSQSNISVGSLNSAGTLDATQTNWNTSDYIPVEEGQAIFIPGKIKYLAYYNINKTSLTGVIPRLQDLNNANITIPTNTDAVKYIRIVWCTLVGNEYYRTSSDVKIYNTTNINLLKPFKEKSINGNIFEDGSIPLSSLEARIQASVKDDNIYFEWFSDYDILRIYMKCSEENSYIGYDFRHMTAVYDSGNSSSNYDVWRLRGVYICTKNLDGTFTKSNNNTLVHDASEWECAIKETGMPDFVGGSTHGDEFVDSVIFLLDGVAYTNPVDFANKSCKELKIVRKSRLYRANTNSATQIATHYVDYLFKNNTITIDNRVDWLVDTNCGISYLCMLGTKRLADDGTTQITSSALKDGEAIIYDVSVADFVNGAGSTLNKCKKAFLWNDKGVGLKTSMSVEILDSNNFPNSNFKFDNRAEYNKFYFDHCGLNFPVANGDKWYNKALYKIDYLGSY